MRMTVFLLTLFLLVSEVQSTPPGKKITSKDFGNRWPFTVNEGYLDCVNNAVIFKANGKTYAINGTAMNAKKYLDVMAIWKDNKAIPGTKVSISPIIDEGLKLCR